MKPIFPAVLLLLCVPVPINAQTRLISMASDAALDGWLATSSEEGSGCRPREVSTAGSLRIGPLNNDDCVEYRSFFSFELAVLEGFQLASAKVVFYQTGAPLDPLSPGSRVSIDQVRLGSDLDLSDWDSTPVIASAAAVAPNPEAAEFKIDVAELVTFSVESGFESLDLRIQMVHTSSSDRFVVVESGDSAYAYLRPRLEMVVTQRVVAPTGFDRGPGQGLAPQDAGSSFIGVALANPSPVSNRVKTAVLDPTGRILSTEDRGLVSRFGQKAFVLEESGNAMLSAWGNRAAFQGFFMIGDDDLDWLDGVGAELAIADELWFPSPEALPGDTVQVFLFNSVSTPDQTVVVEARDPSGEILSTREVELSSPGFLSGTTKEWTGVESGLGSLRISAPLGVRGYQIVSSPHALAAVPGQTVRPTRRLLAPHFFLASGASSRLVLLNQEEEPLDSVIRAFSDQGEIISDRSIELPAGALFEASLDELLDLVPEPSGEALTGYLSIDLASEEEPAKRILGVIDFGSRDGSYRSILPLETGGSRSTLLLQVAQSSPLRIFTGVAILNAESEEAEVRVQVYDRSGNITGDRLVILPPRSRVVSLLNEDVLFGPDFSQVGGHVRLTSEVPVTTFAIFGDYDLRYLSAIESQRPTGTFESIEINQTVCDDNTGPGVVLLDPDPRIAGPLSFQQGTHRVSVRFWDNSRVSSPLGGYQRGIAELEWDTQALDSLGIQSSASEPQVGIFLYDAGSTLDLTVPDGLRGEAELEVSTVDVEGCSTKLRIPLLFNQGP